MNEEESNLFDDQLLDYEIFLTEFFLDIAREKRTNLKISNMGTQLFIHDGLTQEELKTLSLKMYNKTNDKTKKMSIGTISTYLSVMTGLGFKKERIPGTHKYKYFFPRSIKNISDFGFERAFESFFKLGTFLKEKKRQLLELEKKSKKGASILIQSIDELLETFEHYRALFRIFKSGGKDKIE